MPAGLTFKNILPNRNKSVLTEDAIILWKKMFVNINI
jgi:hypothetical protein